jgi:uncharacterized protein (TIGR00730 family)
MIREFKKICVYCGSREGKREGYRVAAQRMGALLAHRGIGLVYGGGSIGLMGVVADAVLAGGGHVTGVIPEALAKREIMHAGAQEMFVVDSMHTRKAKMAVLSDALIAMPGGFGTFEEFFEMVTWAQIGIQEKPIGLLNIEGYYDPLLALVERGIEDGFIHTEHRDLFVSATTPEELLDKLERHANPPSVLRLMNLDQS